MAHLICNLHKRRVMVLTSTTVHRSDGGTCNGNGLSINGRITNAKHVRGVVVTVDFDTRVRALRAQSRES